MAALKPRERWLVVAASAVAVVALGYSYGVQPLLEKQRETQELIAARQSLLARQHRLLGRQERYAAELQGLQAELTQRRARLLPGDKAPIAASELQKLVKATAQESGAEIRSERILPPADRGNYTEVPIEVTLTGPIRALTALLYRLEAAPVTVTLNDVRVRVVSVTAPRELSATLSLAGYIMAAPTAPGRGPAEPVRRPGT